MYRHYRYTTSYPLGTDRGRAPTLARFERDTSELSDDYTFDWQRPKRFGNGWWLAVNNSTAEEDYYFDFEADCWLPTKDDR